MKARELIAAQDSEIKAGREALNAMRTRIKLMADVNQAQSEQIEALKTALRAREEQVAEMAGLIDKFKIRVADLEKSRSRTRKFAAGAFLGGLVLGAAATR